MFPLGRLANQKSLHTEGAMIDKERKVQKRLFYLDAQTHVPMIWKIFGQNNKL